MLYHFAQYLSKHFDIPGIGVFQYLSFRASIALIVALLVALLFGLRIIKFLQRKQIGEEIRNLGLEGQMQKKGTPTMGGIIILTSVLVPIFLLGDLTNIYIILIIISTFWLGTLGFLDDYIKVFKKNKEGLSGKFKIIGQVGLGVIVGATMWCSSDIVVREKTDQINSDQVITVSNYGENDVVYVTNPEKTTKTTIPFVKNNEFDYSMLVPGSWDVDHILSWLIYVLAAIFIITAVSNGANLTDGLDGLTSGVSAVIIIVLGVLAYLSGNVIYSGYLNIMYIPNSGELVVYAAAFVGALLGFLWYNGYPAQVFMGDTGSLSIGGIIAVFALLIRKELLLPILCGVFLIESLSVIIQVTYFKYTKKRYGEGKRIFLMSPLHHHYQKKGYFESKIVLRFWIIQLLLAAITLVTLKIR
ncbi:MAG: phospho-N-acetylmuramoyl-pentapeptide-transferase [Rikenellaceae bacterium]|nr:phospho-N-acetylmuramoyl-pentapeptide-transferase [Rikenellaceae bacterium]